MVKRSEEVHSKIQQSICTFGEREGKVSNPVAEPDAATEEASQQNNIAS